MIVLFEQMEEKKDPTFIIPSRTELYKKIHDLLLTRRISKEEAANYMDTYKIVISTSHAEIEKWKENKIKNPLDREFFIDSFKAWINVKKNDWLFNLDRIDKDRI